jgi:hypothetical protein
VILQSREHGAEGLVSRWHARPVTHLLIRGIGLCGATGEFEATLVPDDATCPSCRVLLAMLREKGGAAEAPAPARPVARVKLKRRPRHG